MLPSVTAEVEKRKHVLQNTGLKESLPGLHPVVGIEGRSDFPHVGLDSVKVEG